MARPGTDGGSAGRARAPARSVGLALALLCGCALGAPRPIPSDVLAPLEARAERARGLRFGAPLAVQRVAPRGVRAVLEREFDTAYPGPEFARAEALERAIGLLPAHARLRDALLDLQAGSVAGFYTPLAQKLYVVHDGPIGGPLPPEVEGVLVHELVHALQAEHTPLLDVLLGLEDDDDLAFSLGALLEGDALLAAFRDQEEQTGEAPPDGAAFAAQTQLDAPEAPGAGAPRILRETFLLQYPLGYLVAETLAARGGTPALDAALRDPPLSSEALLHPERYLAGRQDALPWLEVGDTQLAAIGCQILTRNVFGELGVRIWARERGAAEALASNVAAGWDGDRAVLLSCEGHAAFAWLFQLDAESDAAELADFARTAAGEGADVAISGRRVLLSRGLGEAARQSVLAAPERRFASLDELLAARPEIRARAAALREKVRGAPAALREKVRGAPAALREKVRGAPAALREKVRGGPAALATGAAHP